MAPRAIALAVPRRALAEVVELGLQPLEGLQVLVALPLEAGDVVPGGLHGLGIRSIRAVAGGGGRRGPGRELLGRVLLRLLTRVVGHAISGAPSPSPAPAATAILRGLTSSAFGTRTVSTPFSKVAEISSAFTPCGSVRLRWKWPYARSRR